MIQSECRSAHLGAGTRRHGHADELIDHNRSRLFVSTGGFFTETMQRISRTLCLTTLFFAAGAALFFTKAAVIPYKVAYPVLLLSLSLFYLRLKPLIPVGAALLLSAVGDAAAPGDVHSADSVFRFGARSLHVLLLAAGATCAPAFLSGRC